MSVESKLSPALGAFLSTAVAAAVIVGAMTAPGCGAKPCSPNTGDPFTSVAAVECASGDLCYQGECVPGCNAGAERTDRCDTDSDCGDPSRSKCVDRFCSACDEGSQCVSSLNICAVIIDAQLDGGSGDASLVPTANAPRDGGFIDGSVFTSDTGVEDQPEAIPPSHYATIDIAQIRSFREGRVSDSSTIAVSVVDVSAGGRVQSATVTPPSGQNEFRCDVLSNVVDTGAVPADFGRIAISNSARTPGVNPESQIYEAVFNGAGYSVSPPPPAGLLIFSSTVSPGRFSEVDISGAGNMVLTVGSFPPTGDPSFHVPFELFPGRNSEVQTPELLTTGIQVERPAERKIVLLWEHPRRFAGVNIVVRVPGPTHQIRCTADDTAERVEIVARIMDAFVQANGTPRGTTYPLIFERVASRRVVVPSDVDLGILVDMRIQIRHALVTDITFR